MNTAALIEQQGCLSCGETRDMVRSGRVGQMQSYCRKCHNERRKLKRKKYHEYDREYDRSEKRQAQKHAWYLRNKTEQNARRIQSHRELKLKVLSYYSQGVPRCACCGDIHIEFLALDHINGNGNAHRRELGAGGRNGGRNFYCWVVANSFPDGFQVLCHNCNFAKWACGQCPHQSEMEVSA